MELRSSKLAAMGSAAMLMVSMAVDGADAQQIVTSFAPSLSGPGVWYEFDVRAGGTASTVNLTGEGGLLENDQPLPIGAALLTTDLTNAAKAEVGVPDDYGMPGDILPTFELFYSYFKASNSGQNLFAAPSIKLTVDNQTCDDPASSGDCFGTLVYEPTWNQPGSEGSSVAVPLDQWIDVDIDADNGLFWWTGGFGQPNGAGGGVGLLHTLNEWASMFSSDFDDADIIAVSIGVGSFNIGQIGYFDDVEITHAFGGGFDAWYDFEPAIGPPVDKNECKKGGWMTFNNPPFRNQGQCVSFVVSNRNH